MNSNNKQIINDQQLKIVFLGTPHFVLPVMAAIENNFQLVGIITAPDKKVGRHQTLTPSPVAINAPFYIDLKPGGLEKQKVLCLKPEKFDDLIIKKLKELEPDLFVVASYGKILPKEILDLPKFGTLNIHPSLLPKYRGPSPIQAAILNGDQKTGISIIKLDEEIDHGPIIYQEEYNLSDSDTFDSLSKDMFKKSADILVKVIPDYVSGKLKPEAQDDNKATYTKIIKKEGGYFEIDNPPDSEVLDKMIRAYFPWPTVWTTFNNKIVKFLPGNLVQMEGKKPVMLADFLRGYPNFPLKSL